MSLSTMLRVKKKRLVLADEWPEHRITFNAETREIARPGLIGDYRTVVARVVDIPERGGKKRQHRFNIIMESGARMELSAPDAATKAQ